MQVKVISLAATVPLRATLERMFPEAPVGVQPGVDLRNVSVDAMHRNKLVSHGAARVLAHGRKWHHELASRGAVGLAHATRLALEDDPDVPLLLFEDDALIKDEQGLLRDLEYIAARTHLYDVFILCAASPALESLTEWTPVADMFHLMHAVYYTPRGRRIFAQELRETPLEMQIDSLLGMMAQRGQLRVAARPERGASVVQKHHVSAIQDTCPLCNIHPHGHSKYAVILLALLGTVAGVVYAWHRVGKKWKGYSATSASPDRPRWRT